MNYIIDPNVFYWVNTLNYIKIFFGVLGGILIVAFGFAIVAYIYNWEESIRYGIDAYPETHEKQKKYMKISRNAAIICGIFGFLFLIVCLFIPDKETGIQMLVAKMATFDNVDWTTTQIKEMIDYIVNAIKTI